MTVSLEDDGKKKYQSITASSDLHIDLNGFGENEVDALWAIHAEIDQAIRNLQSESDIVLQMIGDRTATPSSATST